MAARTITLRLPRWITPADRLDRAALAVAGLVVIRLLLAHGYRLALPGPWERGWRLFDPVLLVLFLASVAARLAERAREQGRQALGASAVDVGIAVLALAGLPALYPALVVILFREAAVALRDLMRTEWAREWLHALQTTPERLVLLSFVFLILAGTYLLTLPAAASGDHPASWDEALFTATSAACVTGLVVVDTGSYYSTFGQCVILALIQVGGLGIMTLSTAAALLMGGRIGIRQRRALESLLEEESAEILRRSIRFIVTMTLCVEGIGFAALWSYWWLRDGGAGRSAYLALFHSVSAFCNAGFSLFRDSLVGYRGSAWINFWIGSLIIVGGLGYMVVGNLTDRGAWRSLREGRPFPLQLHSRLVLVTTGALLAAGAIALFFLEFDQTLAGLPIREKILAAGFQSVTLRTAGFSTIDLGGVQPATLLLMVIWMWIGGSPGSTAGGVKTSTVAVLLLLFRALLRGRPRVEAFERSVDQVTIHKAIVVGLVSGIIVAAFLGGLLWLEPALGFERVLFEVVSAFGTVGLSTGITPLLGVPARVLVAALMLAGRVGPLTLALAVGRRRQAAPVAYPVGRVIVG